MKQSLTILFTLFVWASNSWSQTQLDSVSTLPGHEKIKWYSLESGLTAEINKIDFELSFSVLPGFSSSIHFNSSAGAKLWVYPNGTVSDWHNLDTSDINQWKSLYDDGKDWKIGAFDKTDGSDPYDLGWGTYNFITHHVLGDSIYVIKQANGDYKKLVIESLIRGIYKVKYANLNGDKLNITEIDKGDYKEKFFAYLSLANGEIFDPEPVKQNWDLVFCQYIEENPSPNLVSGLLANPNHLSQQVDNVSEPETFEDYNTADFIRDRNVIGSDWKSFNGTNYEINDEVVFFIQNELGDIWKILPVSFGGPSNGSFVFKKTKVVSVGLVESVQSTMLVYPNPCKDSVHISGLQGETLTAIQNTQGKLFTAPNTATQDRMTFDVSSLPKGIYFITLFNSNSYISKKIIKQ